LRRLTLAIVAMTGACGTSSSANGTVGGGSSGSSSSGLTGVVVGGDDDGATKLGSEGGAVIDDGGPTKPFAFTTAPGAYWQPQPVTTMASGNATLTVDASTAYQTITGFGGAFNERGWKVLSRLTAPLRTAALNLLFDATRGANFQYGRIPIGASDYAIARYTEDEVSGADYEMAQFSINQDEQYLIPYVKAALAINPKIHLWGSAWTPPTWMKTGPFFDSSPFDGGSMKGDAMTLQAYARYLAMWVQAYGQQDLAIEMVVPQNEPSYAEGYPSCLWSPSVFDTFVGDYLGPLFVTLNLSSQIFLGTMSKTSSPGDTDIMAAVLSDPAATKYIQGYGMQWTMQSNGTLDFSGNSGVATAISSSRLPIWQTEHQAGNYPWVASFDSTRAPNDYAYGMESWGLVTAWLRAGANSYSAWNMVLDTGGLSNDLTRSWPQDALLVVDTSAMTLTASPAYFVMRHFSQYIQPGASRVATSGDLDSMAFRNPDGSIVAVMHNAGSAAATTILAVGGTMLEFSVPANGYATVVN
jgi:glucosylceramidase